MAAPIPVTASKPWRILVVDDSEDDRADVRRLLLRGSDRTYVFREARSSAAAIRMILEDPASPPDCVVLDYNLCDGTALDVLKALALPSGACMCPVVVLTGDGGRALADGALRAGAQEFVGKAWSTEESLTRSVENAVERWRMSRELQATEARFRHLASAVPEAVWMTDDAGRLVYVNERWKAAFGAPEGGHELTEFLASKLHPEDKATALAYVAGRRAMGEPFGVDVRLRCVNGEYCWYQKTGTPVRDEHDRVVHWYGVTTDIHDRKETALRLALALEASKTGIWTWELATNAVSWTPEAYAIHGMREGDFLGTSAAFFALVHADDRQEVEHAIRSAIRDRTLYTAEFRIIRPGGEVVWVRNLGRAIHDDTGPLRVIGSIIDVTEHKRAEAALRAKERELRSLADTSPHIIARFDSELRHLFISAAIEKLTGRSASEFIGKTHRELGMPPALCDDLESAIRSVFDGGAPQPLAFELDTPDGVRYIEARLAPEHNADGRVVFVVCAMVDVTEQRTAQETIRASEERLARAQRAAHVGTWDWNIVTGEAMWTDEAWRLFGSPRTEAPVTFETWLAAIHPDDRESAGDRSMRALEEGTYHDVFRVLHPDGSILALESSGEAVFDSKGAPIRLLGTVRDITESLAARRALQDALDQATRAVVARDHLMTLVSHDLRNPLNVILMSTSLLEQHVSSEGQRALRMLTRQTSRMIRMIDELLDASLLRAGRRLELSLRDVDLVALAREAMEEAQQASSRHSIQLEASSTSIIGRWDHTRLESVVTNLLSNAVKYSPAGGRIRVALESIEVGGAPWVVMNVADEGIGIREQDHQQIFDWFARAKNSRGIQGVGIGLAGVRHIVEEHGGTIAVESSVERKGSTFTVRLPLRPPTERLQNSPHEP